MDNNSDLDELYRLAEYVIDDGPIRFKMYVGEQCAELDRLLADFGCLSWAFLSAHNPRSTELPAHENDARHARLTTILNDRGERFFAGYGHARDGSWTPETSVLIVGIDRTDAIELARQFEQHAILAGYSGSAPELLWC